MQLLTENGHKTAKPYTFVGKLVCSGNTSSSTNLLYFCSNITCYTKPTPTNNIIQLPTYNVVISKLISLLPDLRFNTSRSAISSTSPTGKDLIACCLMASFHYFAHCSITSCEMAFLYLKLPREFRAFLSSQNVISQTSTLMVHEPKHAAKEIIGTFLYDRTVHPFLL